MVPPLITWSNQRPGGPRSPPGDASLDRSSSSSSESSEIITETNDETNTHYGDYMCYDKPPSTFRGISCQLGRLPVDRNDPKYEALIQSVLQRNIDVVAMQEIGLNFTYAGVHDQWKQRLGWNSWLDGHKARTVNAWNKLDKNKGLEQYGGVAMLAIGRTSFYAAGSGVDPKQLGRWCWTRYQGKNGTYLRMVSFYRPCASSSSGSKTVSATQQRCLLNMDDDRHPRQAFMEDLRDELLSWINKGDALIVCGDINEDILSHNITSFFDNLGLRHLIFSKHDSSLAPATYYRNQNNVAVDGIWASPCLELLRGGYLPKHEFPGDHRPIWFELSYADAFGHELPKIWRAQARRLQLRDPRCVKKYNKELRRLLLLYNLPYRLCYLESSITDNTMTPWQQQEAWDIDILATECQILAEEKCRKLHMGAVQFSPQTMIPRYQVAFWRIAIRRREGEQVSTNLWTRFKKKAKITVACRHLTLDDMKKALTEAYSAYKLAKKFHIENRLSFIESFPPDIRDRILRSEEARRKGRIARSITGKLQGGSVTTIHRSELHNGNEVLHECITPQQVYDTLLQVNSSKYQQCDNSCFLQEPLLSEFGYLGDSANSESVLAGTYVPPPGTNYYGSLLLNHMKYPPGMDASTCIPDKITTEEHALSWKRAKEYTSSGISGLHFGMFKSAASDPDLVQFDAARRSIAYNTGQTYPRWFNGIDVMLLKASGDTRAHKLRTILLLEADFNMNNKHLSRLGMWNAEKYPGCLAPEQCGGRRDHRSNETSLNSTLICDDSRFKRKAMAICSNDAKGCFDRMVHSVTYICLRRLGIPKFPLLSMFQVIQKLTHHIRTAFGDSDETYGPHAYNGPHPNQGILQGNGAAMLGWTAVSSVIVNTMRDLGFGYSSWSAISKAALKVLCIEFVDDTDLIHAGADNYTSGAAIITEMQDMLDHWDGLLRATGGALEQQKSYWYLIDYERRKNKWCYKSPSSIPGELLLFNDATQEREPIPRLSVRTAQKALGIFTSPSGSMDSEARYLRSKAVEWANALSTRRINKEDAWYCLNSTIMKTIEHPLVATSLTPKHCSRIMSPILKAALHSVRVQKNLPRPLVYGPIKYQGLGVSDPWAIQLIHHLHCILRHCSRYTITGLLHNANMENLVLELGSGSSFWQLDYELWSPLATPSWITTTWKDLQATALSLQGPLILPTARRLHDVFLMDAIVSMGVSADDLRSLNDMRMFKQVIRLSDITSADGIYLLDKFLDGSPPNHPSAYVWPRAYRPSPNQVLLWRTTIMACFVQHSRRLAIPLGHWLPDDPNELWDWWHSPSLSCILKSDNGQWIKWNDTGIQYGRPSFQRSAITYPTLPCDAVRSTVSVSANGSRCKLLNTGSTQPSPAPPPVATSVMDRISMLPPSLKWALDHVDAPEGFDTIAQAIQAGHCFAVTDGSLKLPCGTAAFTLVGPTAYGSVRAVHAVPGPLSEGNSYRVELSGILGILVLTSIICQHYEITQGSIPIYCDNEKSLNVLTDWFIPNPEANSFDIINAIRRLLTESPLSWTGQWVAGHQDAYGTVTDRFAILNCEMDQLAGKYRTNLITQNPNYVAPTTSISGEGWSIWCGTEKLHSPSKDSLYEHIYAPKILAFWTKTNYLQATPRLSPAAAPLVDWTAVEKLMKSLPAGKQRWCTKHGSENCGGVGKTAKAWRHQEDDKCLCCGTPDDTAHTLRCTASDFSAVWDENITTMTLDIEAFGCCPDLSTAVASRLNAWRQNIHFLDDPSWSPSLLSLLQAQDLIGWKNLMEGLPSTLWLPYLSHYLSTQGSLKHPSRVLTRILKAINTLAWSQWDRRNKYIHDDGNLRDKAAVDLLDSQIADEFLRGPDQLPPSDHHHFSPSLLSLILRSTSYKKAWYLNVTAARHRHLRRLALDAEERAASAATSRLTHWIRTGRLR